MSETLNVNNLSYPLKPSSGKFPNDHSGNRRVNGGIAFAVSRQRFDSAILAGVPWLSTFVEWMIETIPSGRQQSTVVIMANTRKLSALHPGRFTSWRCCDFPDTRFVCQVCWKSDSLYFDFDGMLPGSSSVSLCLGQVRHPASVPYCISKLFTSASKRVVSISTNWRRGSDLRFSGRSELVGIGIIKHTGLPGCFFQGGCNFNSHRSSGSLIRRCRVCPLHLAIFCSSLPATRYNAIKLFG